MREDGREVNDEGDDRKEAPTETPSERVHTEKSREVRAEHVSPPVKPYKPPVPYPQMLMNANEEHKYGKFLEMLKKFHINILIPQAIIDMPSYVKFLMDLLSNKVKLL